MQTKKGIVLILGAALLWSLGGVLIKVINWDPIAINGLRSIIAFVVMACFRRSFKFRMNKIIALAAFAMCSCNLMYVVATKWTTAANAIVFQYTSPIWVLIFSIFILKTKPSKGVFACTGLAFAGILLVFLDQIGGGSPAGDALALLSGVSFAGVFFINKLPGASTIDSCMLGYIVNFVIGIPFYFSLQPLEPIGYVSMAALGIFQLGMAYICFSYGIKEVKSVTASLISIIEAILNPIWVFLVVGEAPSALAIAGICVVLIAIVAVTIIDGKENKISFRKKKE